jgi:hypothetical protein
MKITNLDPTEQIDIVKRVIDLRNDPYKGLPHFQVQVFVQVQLNFEFKAFLVSHHFEIWVLILFHQNYLQL